ncbi:hypothetical protein Vretifemale_12065 [Volvox reticuliferus]|uniref:ADP/ATP translocase n=1 Tax=Volvox reticuliferus TaxID=1737510 RepID=A0A8J4CMQ1_9CHLO|nr:hypothetical protein Vretifemale_12065 [Volvox reticuliferus]
MFLATCSVRRTFYIYHVQDEHHRIPRTGVMDTLNSTQRSGGLTALYRGFGVSATAIGAYKALYFGLYDTACAAMEQRAGWAASAAGRRPHGAAVPWAAATKSGSGALGPSASSTAASSVSATTGHQPRQHHLTLMQRWATANLVVLTASSLTYPLDVVRKRLVADTALGPSRQQYRGFVDCVMKIARTEGLGGFYRFYGYDMMLRLGGGILLVLYDELKTRGPGSVARQLLSLVAQPGHGFHDQQEEQER